FTIDALREIYFPAQPIGQSEFGADPPRVLAIEKPALLAFRRIQTGADEPLERCDVPQQERGESQASSTCVGGITGVEVQQSRSACVARNTKDFGVADI